MFERFTQDARTAVEHAQEVARTAGSQQIDTRHLLVALIEGSGSAADALGTLGAEPRALGQDIRAALSTEGIDAEALATLGIDLDAITREAERIFGPGALAGAGGRRGHIRFAPEAKKALELALREAIRLKHRTIDSSHLMLGILRADGSARTALTDRRIDVDALRHALEQRPAKSA